MNTMYVPAFAAFGGSAFGAISTIVTGWVTSAPQASRASLCPVDFQARAALSKLHRGSLPNSTPTRSSATNPEIPQLVNLYALIGRMRILSSDEVVQAAERAGRLIIETYLSPNREFVDLPEFMEEMDPLRGFGEACRRELHSIPSH